MTRTRDAAVRSSGATIFAVVWLDAQKVRHRIMNLVRLSAAAELCVAGVSRSLVLSAVPPTLSDDAINRDKNEINYRWAQSLS